jgi:hypothetical protein
MRRAIQVAIAAITVLGSSVLHLYAVLGPFDGTNFKGRIAYSADGNHNDPDDWAASPVVLALFAGFGVKDKLVHFDYNSILTNTDTEWEKTHETSVLGAVERYGYDRRRFHNCRQYLEAAVASIAGAVNDSSAANPLYFIVAGPMQVPVMGLLQSRPEARKHVYVISHSNWNDGLVTRYSFKKTKRDVIGLGVNWVQIRDQNRLLAFSKYGTPARPEEFAPYFWMRDSNRPEVRFLWDRMVVSTRPDVSDSGMAYFLLTGDEEADPVKYKRVLEDKIAPQPVAVRPTVRIEAENFESLDGYEVEITDTAASHRTAIRLKTVVQGHAITHFRQPYTAPRGRYDVEVRHFDDAGQQSQFKVSVNGKPIGAIWKSPGVGHGWTTHTIRGVELSDGDQIRVDTVGQLARLDYIQLNLQAK